MPINRLTREQNNNPYISLPPEQLDQMIAEVKQKIAEQQTHPVRDALRMISTQYKQDRGIKEPADTLNDLIMRERIKQSLNPRRWQPSTMEEALEFEREKLALKPMPQKTSLEDLSKITGEGLPPGTTMYVNTPQGRVSLPLSPRMTEGMIKTSAGAEEVLTEITELEKIMRSEPQGVKASIPFFGSSAQAQGMKIPVFAPYGITEKGQEYRTLRESINNRLLYLRTGAQINQKEYLRLSGMFPEIFRSDKVDLQQLARFKNEFGNILNRIRSGAKWDETKKEFVLPQGQSASPTVGQDQFRIGQTHIKDGVTYTYQGDGQWSY